MTHFEYHYAHYKCAGIALSKPCDPKEFARLDAIREAARTAIALDAGIIETIPSDGRLSGKALTDTALLIRRYEIANQEEEIQETLDPNWMYDALDEGLAA